MNKNSGLLYISYDGMLEPLGQSQVLAYQERLAKVAQLHLMSFEKPADWANHQDRETVGQRIRAAGIQWHARKYHKRPSALATAYDILIGIITGLWLIWFKGVRLIHARSYVPGVMALMLKKLTGVAFIFDMRGFWADERVDGGLWPRDGRMYKVAKWFERHLLLNADHVVSLTHAAVSEMKEFSYLKTRFPQYSVIPTCADLTRFKPRAVAPKNKESPFVVGYVGSAGTWYLFDEVAACFALLLRKYPEARLLVVNRGEHSFIRGKLEAAGVPASSFELTSATHSQVPEFMARMDAAIFFIKPVFSKQASAPTKLGEFLGCGIPCLGNAGVGDMAAVLEEEGVGVALAAFDEATMQTGLDQLIDMAAHPEIQQRCVKAAHKHFSLDEGVQRYARIYKQLETTA